MGSGACKPYKLRIEGENFEGVVQAVDLLREVNTALLDERDCRAEVGQNVVVIGGGNAAVDAAVTARRLGASSVRIVYRRSFEEMPAWEEERRFAEEQGVTIETLTTPIRFHGTDGRLSEVECIRVELGEPDESGRKRPFPVGGTEFTIPCDTAVLAVGQGPGILPEGLETNRYGLLVTDEETMSTSVPGIFAGGDVIRGGATAVQAVSDGKRAAFSIDRWIQSQNA